MEYNELVTVFTLSDPIKAEIIKNALHSEGIRAFLEGADQAAASGLMAIPIRVQVPAHDADRATKFIEQHEKTREE